MLCNVDNVASVRRGVPCQPQSVPEPACFLHNLASTLLYLGRVVSLCPQLCVRSHMWSCLWRDLQKSTLSVLLPSEIGEFKACMDKYSPSCLPSPQLDGLIHRFITLLADTSDSRSSESRVADANMACRKLAVAHPILLLRCLLSQKWVHHGVRVSGGKT